jgi:hypothetical protein
MKCFWWWPHRCKRRLNHFLYRNQCDLRDDYYMGNGDEAVFCIVRTEGNLVWARAMLAGPPFMLPDIEVWDSEFKWAVPLHTQSIRWRHPPYSKIEFLGEGLTKIGEDKFSEFAGNENCEWREYPPVGSSPIDSWKEWNCPNWHRSCMCRQRPYEEPPKVVGARIHDCVKFTDLTNNEPFVYTLVQPVEADPMKGRISIDAPMGKTLHWRKRGEVVRCQMPSGVRLYRIDDIEHRN